MEFDLPKVPTLSGDAHEYLMSQLSADTQLKQGLMDTHHNQSEAFKLGLLFGLSQAQRVADRMFHQDDL